jgi:hypothetical protein
MICCGRKNPSFKEIRVAKITTNIGNYAETGFAADWAQMQ